MKGDEVCKHLSAECRDGERAHRLYVGLRRRPEARSDSSSANVIGSLNKPFTSDLLLKTVEKYMPKETSERRVEEYRTRSRTPPASRNRAGAEPRTCRRPRSRRGRNRQSTDGRTCRWREPEPAASARTGLAGNERSQADRTLPKPPRSLPPPAPTSDAWWSAPVSSTPSQPSPRRNRSLGRRRPLSNPPPRPPCRNAESKSRFR